MTTTKHAIRPLELAMFNALNAVFETITDYFVDGLDLDGELWERDEPSLNCLRDCAYAQKEELFARLWPGLSYDEAQAQGEMSDVVGRAPITQAASENALRPFKESIFWAIHEGQTSVSSYLLECAGAANWEDFAPELDDLRTDLLEREEALLGELWPGRSLAEVIAMRDTQ